MPKSWNVSLKDYLAPNGTVSVLPPPVLRIANYWTEIVSQASNYDEPTTLKCRRWSTTPLWRVLDDIFRRGHARRPVVLSGL